MLDRALPPPIQPIADFPLIKPVHTTLTNQLPAHFIRAGVQPIVSVQLIFEAGAWFAPNTATNYFTAKMLLEGTKKHNSTDFITQIDNCGATLEASAAMDFAGIDLVCLKKHLPTLLRLVAEMLTEATFPTHELEKLKMMATQNIRINAQKTSMVATNELRAGLFGQTHPYGYSMTEEAVSALRTEDLQAHYCEAFEKQPFRVLAAGDITEQEIGFIDEFLGKLPIQKFTKIATKHQTQLTTTPQCYIEKENAVQTSLRIGKHVLQRTDADFVPFNVLNTILGGFFGSRLMKNIRVEKGLSYGISSSLMMLRNAGYMLIGTDVKKELRQQALDEIYKEIRKLTQEPVSQEELTLVKNYMKGSFINSLNTPFALADRYRNIFTFGLPEDYYDHQIQRLDAVTPEHLIDLANKYYQSDFIEVMVG